MSDLCGRGYVGGGSIAAICGLSPFSTPLDAYLHIVEPQQYEAEELRFFRRRKALEPFASQCFEMATGLIIDRTNVRYDDAEFPWAKAEIDFEVPYEVDDSWNGETKTIRQEMARFWGNPDDGERPPAYVEAQAQWGMGVHPADGCFVHGLLGLDDDLIYVVERDDEVIKELRARALNFWTWHVEKRRPPQPVNVDDILRLFPRDTGRQVEATDEVLAACEKLDKAKRAIKAADADKTLAEFPIKNHMRDAAVLTQRGKPIATFKTDSRGVRSLRLL